MDNEKKFRARQDMDTLIEAAKIKQDKTRHIEAIKMIKQQRKAIKDVTEEGKDDE